MVTLIEMDERVTLGAQLQEKTSPVVLINKFTVQADEADQLQEAWFDDAAWFRQQPGFVSAQLHRGIGGSCVFLNYAVWESVDDFRRAFTHPEFREKLAKYPPTTVASPHLFETITVGP
jgi:heme-degrading monooxygenase HmoA